MFGMIGIHEIYNVAKAYFCLQQETCTIFNRTYILYIFRDVLQINLPIIRYLSWYFDKSSIFAIEIIQYHTVSCSIMQKSTIYRKPMGEKLFEEEFTIEALSQMGNPLDRLAALVDFKMFRPALEEVLFKKDCKTPAGRPQIDVVLLFLDAVYESREDIVKECGMNPVIRKL